jgi:hypothetical protein
MSGITYLAVPYTWNPERSFEIANKVSSYFMAEGKIIFSPVSHSHHIADHMAEPLRLSQEFWMNQDLPILRICDEIIFVLINAHDVRSGEELLEKSKGCMRELSEAILENKSIKMCEYVEFEDGFAVNILTNNKKENEEISSTHLDSLLDEYL